MSERHPSEPARDKCVREPFRLIAKQLPALPEDAVYQLHAALGTRLALPSPAARRRERLIVILDFLALHGRPPTWSEYVEDAQARAARGEPGVPASTLEELYGGYANAVDIAARLYVRGTAARAPAAKPVTPLPKRYWTEARAIEAVQHARSVLGHWPQQLEFEALRRAGERLRASNGWKGLVLPPEKVIRRLFDNYGELLATAQRRARARQQQAATASETSAPRGRKGRSVRRRPRSKNVKPSIAG